jgi:subtilisin family serine protease
MKSVLTIISLFIGSFILGQNAKPVSQKGTRPIIDLAKVPTEAFEAGKISVKFKKGFLSFLKQHQPTITQGVCLFGIKEIDQLNRKFGVSNGKQLFSISQSSKTQLHEDWGFNLWFNLSLPNTADIKKIVTAYANSGLFDVVEPLYKTETVGTNSIQSFSPNDMRFAEQWNLKNTGQAGGTIGKDLNITDAWDIEKGKPAIIVAMIDRGIQYNHPDLAQNMWSGIGYNFLTNSPTITPEDHGTCTAGIVGAVSNNNSGISGIAGGDGSASTGIRLMSCQIFAGTNTNGNIAEALIWAADHGACIASNSWIFTVAGVYRQSVLDAIDYFCSNGGGYVLQGGLVIAAAGNNGDERLSYPGCYEKVIGVSATNNKDIKSSFSNYGNWVDISAPGGDATGDAADIPTTSTTGYTFFSGTSASSPHVAGVAALLASKLAGKASASDIREILLSTTDDIYPINQNYLGKLGTGRLNAYKALQKAQAFLSANNVVAPISFTGSTDCKNIVLSWAKNSSNNDVMIVYSGSNNIGIPANGTNYTVGGMLATGKVIYKGNASSFNFDIPNNDIFQYFKIWSVSAANQYSFGKQVEIMAGPVYEIADNSMYEEDFEGLSFPYQSLRVSNPDKAITWGRSDLAKHTGSVSVFMDNFSYPAIGQVDTMFLPQLKFANADSIKLSFWKAYKAAANTDSLAIIASFDCGKTYSTIWKQGGNQLATVPGSQATLYIPADAHWKKEEITFGIPVNAEKVIIAFKAINANGQNLYIDNINVKTKTLPQKLKADGLMVSPNPFSKQVTVQHYLPPIDLKAISIFNNLGQKVFYQTYTGNAGSYMVLELGKLTTGVYHFRFDYADRSVTKKMLKI